MFVSVDVPVPVLHLCAGDGYLLQRDGVLQLRPVDVAGSDYEAAADVFSPGAHQLEVEHVVEAPLPEPVTERPCPALPVHVEAALAMLDGLVEELLRSAELEPDLFAGPPPTHGQAPGDVPVHQFVEDLATAKIIQRQEAASFVLTLWSPLVVPPEELGLVHI